MSFRPPDKIRHIQGSPKRLRPGLVSFVSAVAYHCCLSLPAAFTQPGRSLLADPCILSLQPLCILYLQFTFDGVDNLSMHSSYNESPPEQSPDAEEYFAKWDSGSEDMYAA